MCLKYVVGAIDAEFFTTILRKGLLPAVNEGMRGIWTLQQDDAPILCIFLSGLLLMMFMFWTSPLDFSN